MAKKRGPSRVELAARLYGCEVGELLSQHEFKDGSVAIIAPTGQKFVYSAERILEEQDKDMAPTLTDSQEAGSQKAAADSRVAAVSEQGGHHVVEKPKPVTRN